MSDIDTTEPPIALVCGDADGSNHLRAMLEGVGARVVYDVDVGALDATALSESGAKVVLINLDDAVEARLDELYSTLDDGGYRVVFNDPESSSALSGWEQARWARHLGAKLRDDINVDPPRPQLAEPVVVAVAEPATPSADESWMADALGVLDQLDQTDNDDGIKQEHASASTDPVPETGDDAQADSGNENEFDAGPALTEAPAGLADPGDVQDEMDKLDVVDLDVVDESVPTLDETATESDGAMNDSMRVEADETDAEPMAGADGGPDDGSDGGPDDRPGFEVGVDESSVFDAEVAELLQAMDDLPGAAVVADATSASSSDDHADREPAVDENAALALSEDDDSAAADVASDVAPAGPEPADVESEVGVVQIDSSQWALVDYSLDDISETPLDDPNDPNASVAPKISVADALASREFGIELVDPIEYLAPASPAPVGEELYAAPELVSMKEAVAPHVDGESPEETSPRTQTLARVVVLGASIGGPDAVREFLAALPPRFPATFILVQHLGSEFVDLMISQLARSSALPVRQPAHAEQALSGEVLVVPRGRQMLLSRDGEVELRDLPDTSAHDPSINLTMAMAAEAFGTDTLAIVFSGMANDAVSGALEVAAHGGSVWAQDPDHCVVSSMVDAVIEAGVVKFTGTPTALAQRLIDEFGTESPP